VHELVTINTDKLYVKRIPLL